MGKNQKEEQKSALCEEAGWTVRSAHSSHWSARKGCGKTERTRGQESPPQEMIKPIAPKPMSIFTASIAGFLISNVMKTRMRSFTPCTSEAFPPD